MRDRHAEIGAWTVVLPDCLRVLFLADKGTTIFAAEVDRREGACYCIEASGVDQDVENVRYAVRCLYAGLGDSSYGCGLQVDELNIWFIVDFEVATLKRYTPGAKSVVFRDEFLCNCRIVDSGPNLVRHEVRVEFVCFAIGEGVAEDA